jgi:serine/threonine-protein kinase
MVKEKESFKLLEHLGTGSFAQTWKAEVIDPDLIDEWGLKTVAIKIPLSKQKERALRRDIELSGSLYLQITEVESKNIVKYLGFEIYDGKIVMVMKYISGGNLRSLIGNLGHQKKLEFKKAYTIALGILEGLSVIHKHRIIHRDIKPENILMNGDIPQVSDLGVGRLLKVNELAETKTGTLFYMSPEILLEGRALFNADLWSFGITFYEMLCGEFPFGINEKIPEGKIMDLITDSNVKVKFPAAAEVPLEIQGIIKKILEKNPNYRYKTADQVIDNLKKFFINNDETVEKGISLIQQCLLDPFQTFVAEDKLKKILKKFPESPRIYLHLGEFYNKRGSYDKAIKMFEKGIDRDPTNALFYWDISIAYQDKGDFKSAINAIKKALDLGLERSLERYARVLLKTLQNKM